MRDQVRRRTSHIGLVAFALACSYPAVEAVRLEDGRPLGALAADSGVSVILILHPSECLQCLTNLGRWSLAAKSNPTVPVDFVLSRSPTEQELTQLRLHRLRYSGVVGERLPINGLKGLHALVFDHARLVESLDITRERVSDSLLHAISLPSQGARTPP